MIFKYMHIVIQNKLITARLSKINLYIIQEKKMQEDEYELCCEMRTLLQQLEYADYNMLKCTKFLPIRTSIFLSSISLYFHLDISPIKHIHYDANGITIRASQFNEQSIKKMLNPPFNLKQQLDQYDPNIFNGEMAEILEALLENCNQWYHRDFFNSSSKLEGILYSWHLAVYKYAQLISKRMVNHVDFQRVLSSTLIKNQNYIKVDRFQVKQIREPPIYYHLKILWLENNHIYTVQWLGRLKAPQLAQIWLNKNKINCVSQLRKIQSRDIRKIELRFNNINQATTLCEGEWPYLENIQEVAFVSEVECRDMSFGYKLGAYRKQEMICKGRLPSQIIKSEKEKFRYKL